MNHDREIARLANHIARLERIVCEASRASAEEKQSLLSGLASMRVKIAGLYRVEKPCRRCDEKTLCGDDCLNGGNV